MTYLCKSFFLFSTFFYTNDILALLEKEPKLININSGIARNAGLKKSLDKERIK
jgi:hypothetical protein